jgi:hypothetical protein
MRALGRFAGYWLSRGGGIGWLQLAVWLGVFWCGQRIGTVLLAQEVYGLYQPGIWGGGNTNAPFNADFVELFNSTGEDRVRMAGGWRRRQQVRATGRGWGWKDGQSGRIRIC